MLPLVEAKMLHHYDTRWATYLPDSSTRTLTLAEKADETFHPMPRYWVAESEVDRKLAGKWDKSWLLGWRDICRATDARTVVTTQLPRVGIGHKVLLGLPEQGRQQIQALWSSFFFDYVARQKLGGTSMAYFIMTQLPMPTPTMIDDVGVRFGLPVRDWIASRVDRLNARPTTANAAARSEWREELDALACHLYGLAREDVDYILDTFPIVRRQDVAAHGEFRTKRLILEFYDAMHVARAEERVYQSPREVTPA